jgi:hypothetical protein
MLKLALTALATAALTVAACAATGLARGNVHSYTLKVGDRVTFPSDDFQCQAVAKTQVACGSLVLKNSVQVYYAPKQLALVKFGTNLTKGQVLTDIKR